MTPRHARFLSALGALALGAGMLAAPAPAAQAPLPEQDDSPSLTTEDVLLIPDAASYEMASKRAEMREHAALEKDAKKATKGYLRITTPTGFAFERPEAWQAVDNLQAKGAPGGFQSDAIYQDPKTGAVLTALSFNRVASKTPLDIGDKSSVDSVLNSMLNPSGDPKATVKVVRRESGEVPDQGLLWVRVKASGVSQAQGGGTVPATYWVQMAQTSKLLAVVAVAYPADQESASVPAFHAVRTLEVLDVGTPLAAAAAAAAGQPGQQPPAGKAKKDSAGGVRKP